MKVGILGGTFDPIHFGHLRIAEETGQKLCLEKVYLVPSSCPPHKADGVPVTPFEHRLAMAELGAANSPLLEVLDLEGKRPGLSYSIETLRELSRTLSSPELFFILGTDAFLEIETWKDYTRLFDYADFVVVRRPGCEEKNLDSFILNVRGDIRKTANAGVYKTASGKSIIVLTLTLLAISSTGIRQMAAKGLSFRFLVPETVRQYIMDKGLYRDDPLY